MPECDTCGNIASQGSQCFDCARYGPVCRYCGEREACVCDEAYDRMVDDLLTGDR